MNTYELTIITRNQEVADKIASSITDLGGTITATKVHGSRRLAYPLKREPTGFLTTYDFSLAPNQVIKLNKNLGLNSDILRHLIITIKPARAAAPISRLSEEMASQSAKETTDTKETAPEVVAQPEAAEPEIVKSETSEPVTPTETAAEPTPEKPAKKPIRRAKTTPAKEEPTPESTLVPAESTTPAKSAVTATKEETRTEKNEESKAEEPKIEKPKTKKSKPAKPAVESEEISAEQDRLRALDAKLDELLKD